MTTHLPTCPRGSAGIFLRLSLITAFAMAVLGALSLLLHLWEDTAILWDLVRLTVPPVDKVDGGWLVWRGTSTRIQTLF
jgi:hypothetical protein